MKFARMPHSVIHAAFSKSHILADTGKSTEPRYEIGRVLRS